MRWAEQQRIDWIGKRVRQRRKINRKDIMDKFGVAIAQASLDLQKFQKINPDVIQYDMKAKVYRLIVRKP